MTPKSIAVMIDPCCMVSYGLQKLADKGKDFYERRA
jgi:hypothetical protein